MSKYFIYRYICCSTGFDWLHDEDGFDKEMTSVKNSDFKNSSSAELSCAEDLRNYV